MPKKIYVPKSGPPKSPYSTAVYLDSLLFVSGQVPMDSSGKIVEGKIEDQAKQALSNLKGVLEGAGSSLEKVVKTTVFLTNMDDFGRVNEVYRGFFPKDPPARSCVEVARLPFGANVEVEVIAEA